MKISVQATAGKQRVPYISGHYAPSIVTVYDATADRVMRRVAAAPGPGDYTADEAGGVFCFSAEDAGHQIVLSPMPSLPSLLGRRL